MAAAASLPDSFWMHRKIVSATEWDIGVLGSLGATDDYGVQGGEQFLLSLGGVF